MALKNRKYAKENYEKTWHEWKVRKDACQITNVFKVRSKTLFCMQ